jgi:hypothetical protein
MGMLIADISNVMPSPRSITRTLPLTAEPRPRSDATSPGEGPDGAASASRFEEKIDDVELHPAMHATATSTATIGFNENSSRRNRRAVNGHEYVVYCTGVLELFSLQHANDRAMLRVRTRAVP